MGRDIKFRAWDESTSEMVENQNISVVGGEPAYILEKGGTLVSSFRSDLLLMQHTGLKDSKGVEIYEGDIVEFTKWWFDGNEAETQLTGTITYDAQMLSFALKGIKNADWDKHTGGADEAPFANFRFEEDDFRVLGNVHEHPELLSNSGS